MASDIRNFFAGRSAAAQTTPSSNTKTSAARSRGRAKRAVLSDSEPDDVDDNSQHKTRSRPEDQELSILNPATGEQTTTSEYFASSSRAKGRRIKRSSPEADRQTIDSARDDAKGGRKALDYPVIQDDADRVEVPSHTEPSQHNSRTSHTGAAEVENSSCLKTQRTSAQAIDGIVKSAGKSHLSIEQSDQSNKAGLAYKSQSAKEQDSPKHKRKRNITIIEDEAADKDYPHKVSKTQTQPDRALRTTSHDAPIKGELGRSTVESILEDIPTIRPPTPPQRDASKKFDWKTNNNRIPAGEISVTTADIPTGAENCLAGLSFVFTGTLQTLDRTAGQNLVKQYGGKITTAPSKKTSFVVLGDDAGPKKLETIQQHNIRTIDENGLFELLRRLPANGGDSDAAKHYKLLKEKEQLQIQQAAQDMIQQDQATGKSSTLNSRQRQVESHPLSADGIPKDGRLWTVKYAPTASNMICGNKGQVEKLQGWLRAWPSNFRSKFKKPGKDGSGTFRAICLHGSPGIGKTTAAHLAAKLEQYDIVESNASDSRSKKLVETGLRGVLDTTSLVGYFSADGQQVNSDKRRLVLIMDEVDGMSAGDRGGVGAMATTCRKTSIPIILICNDRKLPKLKPFDTVAYDLPFRKPTVDQIRQRLMTICFREKLSISPPVINALIEGSHSDIRQIINMLSTAKLDQEGLNFEEGKKMSQSWEKNIILRPWDIVGKILSGTMFAPSSTKSLNEKIELYFNDHEFSSLMLQENYLGTRPAQASQYAGKEYKLKSLELAEQAAASISDGDLVDRMIHGSQQQWSLMPAHAVLSFVRPASFVAGLQSGGQTRFTSWLGNNSKHNKLMRLIKEIQGHMRLHCSGDRHEIRQQYFPILWYLLVQRLQLTGKDAVAGVIALMDAYYLTKDDWEALVELGLGTMDAENLKIDTQTKTMFTRTYNQQSHPLPYMKASQILNPKKSVKDQPDLEEALDESDSGASDGDEQAVLDDEEPLDLKKDKYVQAPKAKPKSKGKGKTKLAKKQDKTATGADSEEDFDSPAKGKAKNKASTRKQNN